MIETKTKIVGSVCVYTLIDDQIITMLAHTVIVGLAKGYSKWASGSASPWLEMAIMPSLALFVLLLWSPSPLWWPIFVSSLSYFTLSLRVKVCLGLIAQMDNEWHKQGREREGMRMSMPTDDHIISLLTLVCKCASWFTIHVSCTIDDLCLSCTRSIVTISATTHLFSPSCNPIGNLLLLIIFAPDSLEKYIFPHVMQFYWFDPNLCPWGFLFSKLNCDSSWF